MSPQAGRCPGAQCHDVRVVSPFVKDVEVGVVAPVTRERHGHDGCRQREGDRGTPPRSRAPMTTPQRQSPREDTVRAHTTA